MFVFDFVVVVVASAAVVLVFVFGFVFSVSLGLLLFSSSAPDIEETFYRQKRSLSSQPITTCTATTTAFTTRTNNRLFCLFMFIPLI